MSTPICRRIHYIEINDQDWFPQYLREKIQSTLHVCWIFKAPVIQAASPAQLVTRALRRELSNEVASYTYVDFCAGGGGPTPVIEKDLNAQLKASGAATSSATAVPNGVNARVTRAAKQTNGLANGQANGGPKVAGAVPTKGDGVKFVMTDIHPHIPDWTELVKHSDNLSYVPESVDAANAPAFLTQAGGKIFRLYNLAFHHFDDPLALDILKNTLETSSGFGIFELQERTIDSFLTMLLLGVLMFFVTPFYFWRSPGHLFFTYIIPVIPFVVVFDGIVSSLRTRSPSEVQALMKQSGADTDGWTFKSGHEMHTWPTGYLTWIIATKD